MDILLDTNFIITCIKENIYFDERAQELIDEKIHWQVPQDVLNELGNLKDKKGNKEKDKEAAKLSFEILQILKPEIIELKGKSPNVDIKIVNYLLENEKTVLATMDKDLKSRIKNKVLSVRGKNNLELL